MRALEPSLTEENLKELLFLATVAERTLVYDTLSGDALRAQMFPTGTAQASMLVADSHPALFADSLSSLVAQIALSGLVPDYFTGRGLQNFSIGTSKSNKFGRDDRYVEKLDLRHGNIVRVCS